MDSSIDTLDKVSQLKQAWTRFIEEGHIDRSVIRPLVADSWKRCRVAGLDPYSKNHNNILDSQELKELLKQNQYLINVSWPILKILGELIKGSGFMAGLFDRDGYFIKIISGKMVLSKSKEMSSVLGGNRAENVAGTNAIGLVLSSGNPIHIVGPEHYNKYEHFWTCSAAPIHDPSGTLIGGINISGDYSPQHKHTLGMAVSTANAIEGVLRTDEKISELTTTNKCLYTLIESIDDGLIVIDNNGKITNVNSIGGKIVGLKPAELIGRSIHKVLHSDFSLTDVLHNWEPSIDMNVFVRPFGSSEKHHYFVTAKRFEDHAGHAQGVICIFRKKNTVHKLVGGIIGAKARFTFQSIVGSDVKLREAIHIAKIASTSKCKILLQGESGTGKELFAQAIHNNSIRKDKPFLAINCSAIPRDLVESELFGYEEGAFSGAKRGGRPGKFELADGGTLFLDEIESMPLEAQPKLLRVLETNQVMRVGGQKFCPADVRIISSTRIDLSLAVKEDTFREDLFYRLNATTIPIPPLRARKEDILILIEYFLNKKAHQLNKDSIKVEKECLNILSTYSWPGNVRELENVIESAILLTQKDVICCEVLPERLTVFTADEVESDGHSDSLKSIEKKIIQNALRENAGNITRASKILEVDRTTLYRKIKKYSIHI